MHVNTSEGKSKRKNGIRIYSMVWFNWKLSNIWKSTNDTKKYLRQKMYGTEGASVLLSIQACDLETSCKGDINIL